MWCEACKDWELWGRGRLSTQTHGEITAYMLVAEGHVWSGEYRFVSSSTATAPHGRYIVHQFG